MPNVNIDIGLDVLCIVSKPGETLSDRDIAEVCECSRNYIYELEKKALRKLRKNMEHMTLDDYVDA